MYFNKTRAGVQEVVNTNWVAASERGGGWFDCF